MVDKEGSDQPACARRLTRAFVIAALIVFLNRIRHNFAWLDSNIIMTLQGNGVCLTLATRVMK